MKKMNNKNRINQKKLKTKRRLKLETRFDDSSNLDELLGKGYKNDETESIFRIGKSYDYYHNEVIPNENLLTEYFIQYLGKGGNIQYYEEAYGENQIIFESGKPCAFPRWEYGTYFNVNPRRWILSGDEIGGIENVQAVNCLFCEFVCSDIKNEEIKKLNPQPSVVVEAGDNYQMYWLLGSPTLLTRENFLTIQNIQDEWVKFMGGIEKEKDLSALMYVPGTELAVYKDCYYQAFFKKTDFSKKYSLNELGKIVNVSLDD